MSGQRLGKVYGAMLAAGAAKPDHQAGEPAFLVASYAPFHQRGGAGQKLTDACLGGQIIDYGGVFAGERFETIFTARIGQPAGVKNETASVAALVFQRGAPVKGKTENPQDQVGCARS